MPFVIPVFIPHQGCPHTCIFCNQFRISGHGDDPPVTVEQVRAIIGQWLSRSPERTRNSDVQVAFYGGSFTGLARCRQEELLGAVAPFLAEGRVQTIRLSTRPDYIDAQTVAFLRDHGVAVVELGVQSMDPTVLAIAERGHSAGQTVNAVRLLRRGGMQVGIQLMVGLPGQTAGSVMRTVKQVAALQPDFVRIYPVLVLRNSRLAAMFGSGEYRPLSLAKAVVQAARMKEYFAGRGIRVVRLGLQPTLELEKSLVAGPYHPAFGELVNARIMLRKTRALLRASGRDEQIILSISDRDQSVFRGVRSANLQRLKELGLLERFRLVTDVDQPRHTIRKIEYSQYLD